MYELDEIKSSKGMHMAHLNIRSLSNKWENFKLHFSDENLHVLGVSETWLNDSLPNELFELSKNYILCRLDRSWKDIGTANIKKGGGVGLYIDSNLNSSDKDFNRFYCSNEHVECQWVSIKQNHSKLMLIGNLYRPPQGDVDNFIQYLENVFDDIEIDNIELFIMGDFNIDFLDKKDPKCKKLVELIKPLGLGQIIKEPTQPTINRGTCLDLFITNCDNISKAGACNINISGHLPILLTQKKIKTTQKRCTFTGRSYRNNNKDIFQYN